MRKITHIVVHTTASSVNAKIEAIQMYWRNNLKWKSNGYHYIINRDGTHKLITPLDKICNGVKNHNKNSIHVSYIGGIDNAGKSIDNRTIQQKETIIYLLRELKRKFPHAIIQGHRDFPNVKKDCPCFDAKKEYAEIFDYI